MGIVVGAIGNDSRCAVHQCVLGIREGKEGWFHVICPSSAACSDDGSLWASIVIIVKLKNLKNQQFSILLKFLFRL